MHTHTQTHFSKQNPNHLTLFVVALTQTAQSLEIVRHSTLISLDRYRMEIATFGPYNRGGKHQCESVRFR